MSCDKMLHCQCAKYCCMWCFHASYQTKVLVEVFVELLHLCRTCNLGIVLLLPVWALGGKESWLVADKIYDLGHVNVLLTTLLLLFLSALDPNHLIQTLI